MKALGILGALFAGLNSIDDFQGAPQTKKEQSPHAALKNKTHKRRLR